MGALVAILSKKGQDVTRRALDMVQALELKGSRVFGIASPTITKRDCFESLQKLNLNSPIVVAYVFTEMFPQNTPQPLRLEDATTVFDGRVYSSNPARADVKVAARKLRGNLEQAASMFVKRTDGDFAFAIACNETIVAGRDVLGVRPLYYGENEDFAALASERKALWNVGIKDVHSFPPGCVSLVGRNGFKFTVAKRIVRSRPRQIKMQTAACELQALLERSIEARVSGLKEVVVAFSGGLDSSIIACLAKKAGASVVLIHVSLEEGLELESAKQAAEELELPLYSFVYGWHDVQSAIPRVIRIIEQPDPVKVGIGVPLYWTAEKTAKMGCNVMLAGQGADELFGGYKRYLDNYVKGGADEAERAIFGDVIGLYEANLERDFKICNHFNIELRLPFATTALARFAVSLPLQLKIERADKTLRKLVLRRVAANLGLPRSIVDRPKKAIQYATGVNKVIKRIAKKEGMSTSEYVQNVFQVTFQGFHRPESDKA